MDFLGSWFYWFVILLIYSVVLLSVYQQAASEGKAYGSKYSKGVYALIIGVSFLLGALMYGGSMCS